jgi:hypothetical protein
MSIYLNAIVMLIATLAAFVLLTKLLQAVKSRQLRLSWPGRTTPQLPPNTRLAIEQACMVDSKRRLLLVRFDEQRVLLLTGGPADLVVSVAGPAGAEA